ncbi:MAG TPA: DNA mismatch repair endonuclease MutL, partial [Ardenticatenaceae bacterium]
MPIQRLPDDVASKIAAGEVVERPASVVKELAENAIDAGATEIRVEIKGGGQKLIRISDNGSGIPSGELELAFEHHATSKLRAAEDLYALYTLGFRGEALPSIAAISQVTVLSRTREEEAGTQVRIEGGRRIARETRAAPAGTIFNVEELFFNVPARRKFLRTTATENGAISEIVSLYALAYPDRRFSLTIDGRQTFHSPGTGNLEDAVVAVYGIEMVKNMIPLPLVEDE